MKSRSRLSLFYFPAYILTFLVFFSPGLHGQGAGMQAQGKTGDLLNFAKQKNRQWEEEKRRADSLADLLQFPKEYVEFDGRVVILQRLGPKNRPVYYATDNLNAARVISTDQLWTTDGGNPSLTGKGVDINIWDGGAILASHQEFQVGSDSRIDMRNRNLSVSNHSTHIAGTMAASGIVPQARGMAGQASIFGWDFNNDFAEMAVAAADGIFLSNHSYGSLNGWYYNSSNEMWYWYGDPDISPDEDYEFGLYNQVSADLDYIAWSAPQYLIVKSAGNDRGESPENQPIQHLVWDGAWVSASVNRDPDGGTSGYDCLTPMSVAKNILTIGAVDEQGSMTSFSAFGPTDDGRIKPDLVANGTTVYSTLGSSDESYGNINGTSMAAASTTGSAALLVQLKQMLQPGVGTPSSTIKGLLIHTATDMGQKPGPDYQHGWGLIDMMAAAELLQGNVANGGMNIREGTLKEGEMKQITVQASSTAPFLKVTVCWTDPAADPTDASLNPRNKKLINDLDLTIEHAATSSQYSPWVLDVENPGSPATKGANHADNVEQVMIPNPGSGDYDIKISHSGGLSGGSQAFSLIISGISTPENVPPPGNLRFNTYETSVVLNWDAPEGAVPSYYYVYRNGGFLAKSEDLSYHDLNLVTDRQYSYYITALYERDGAMVESLPTNQETTTPRSLRPLPFSVDFEGGTDGIQIKNALDGWQWGNSESLSSYYLDFKSNETHFIATSSYLAGETSHVKDIACTMPLRLAEYSNVKLSFDYMLITGLYSSIDELHVVYKLQDENDWHEWHKLPLGLNWSTVTLDLPPNAYKNGTQIGFYYDDFYQKGMGAGLDNIILTGTQSQSSDLAISGMTRPVSSCILSESEEVSITIENTGTTLISSGEMLEIHMDVSDGTSITDKLILNNSLAPGTSLSHTMNTLIDLSDIGSYAFIFTLIYPDDINLLNNTLETTIEAGGSPEALILNTDLSFCVEGTAVTIQVSPEGGTLSGTGTSGMYFYPATAGVGEHSITYTFTDESGCTASTSEQVTVSPPPLPAILNTNLSFCVEGAPVEILVSPEGGTLTGPGITGIYFCPEMAEVGSHTITYNVTDVNGCHGSVSALVEVGIQPEAEILNTNLSFCIEASPVKIRVSPEGGTLSGPGVLGMHFYPSVAGVGSHTLTYKYIESLGCQASVSKLVKVYAPPTVSILNKDLVFCENHLPELINAIPSGGLLNGPGCSGDYFFPEEAGPGIHTIMYNFTDIQGCIGSCSRLVEVLPIPKANFHIQKLVYCEDDPPVEIEITPEGGILSGPGVKSNIFSPLDAGPGFHTLTYTYGGLNGCVNAIQRGFRVKDVPAVDLGPDLNITIHDTIELWPYTDAATFHWVDGSKLDHLRITGEELGPGTHSVWVRVTSMDTCSNADTILVSIDEANRIDSESNTGKFAVYPNPVDDGFYLTFDENESVKHISIYNQTGQLMMNHIPYSYPYFKVSNFLPGSYFLKIHTENRVLVLKFIKH